MGKGWCDLPTLRKKEDMWHIGLVLTSSIFRPSSQKIPSIADKSSREVQTYLRYKSKLNKSLKSIPSTTSPPKVNWVLWRWIHANSIMLIKSSLKKILGRSRKECELWQENLFCKLWNKFTEGYGETVLV
jgi:hypothetical protein